MKICELALNLLKFKMLKLQLQKNLFKSKLNIKLNNLNYCKQKNLYSSI